MHGQVMRQAALALLIGAPVHAQDTWRFYEHSGPYIEAKAAPVCEIFHGSARLTIDSHGVSYFELPLASPAELYADGIELERLTLRVDNRAPLTRIPSPTERRYAMVRLHARTLNALLTETATHLSIRAVYSRDGVSEAGGHQNLEIDLQGFTPLVPRLFACPMPFKPPRAREFTHAPHRR